MPKALDTWTVKPHGPLEEIEDGILTVQGELRTPVGMLPRRMTVVRLSGGRSAIFSAIALREPEMARLDELGAPAFLIVPNDHHRLDAKIYKQRYPSVRVLAPPGARRAVEEVVPVDATSDILSDDDVRFIVVPGIQGHEAALSVRRPRGTTLIVNDIIANIRNPRGLGARIVAHLLRFGVDRPRVPWMGVLRFLNDRPALAAFMREQAADPGLLRIVPSHGDVITQEPGVVLMRLADGLAR